MKMHTLYLIKDVSNDTSSNKIEIINKYNYDVGRFDRLGDILGRVLKIYYYQDYHSIEVYKTTKERSVGEIIDLLNDKDIKFIKKYYSDAPYADYTDNLVIKLIK